MKSRCFAEIFRLALNNLNNQAVVFSAAWLFLKKLVGKICNSEKRL